MNDFTGRRSNDRARRFGRGILDGLSALGTAMADGPKRARIDEIDRHVADLLQERDHLIADLIEPGDMKVSENYDPRWRKAVVEDAEDKSAMDAIFGEKQDAGRLTKCRGRAYDGYNTTVHPGCPYVETIHGSHEFTLRD